MSAIYVFVERHGNQWVVDRCPICTSSHYFGAGSGSLGSRLRHCAPRYDRFGDVVWSPPLITFELTTDRMRHGQPVGGVS